MATQNDEPNPNWKIDKFRKYLDKMGRYKYKVMWVGGRTFIDDTLKGRAFKHKMACIHFATRLRLISKNSVWVYKWNDEAVRWEKYCGD